MMGESVIDPRAMDMLLGRMLVCRVPFVHLLVSGALESRECLLGRYGEDLEFVTRFIICGSPAIH